MHFSINKNTFIIGFGVLFGLLLAYILFSMFFAEIPGTVPAVTATGVETILPHGTDLNFSAIETHGARTNRFSPPPLDVSAVGVDSLSQLIRP